MSYDGMYSELSVRGTSSQILTQVLEARDQVALSEDNVETLEASAVNSAALATSASATAVTSSATAVSSANIAVTSATTAAADAASAAQSAIDAETNSEAALIVANNALTISNSAFNAANSAVVTATAISGTANTALTNSNAAVTTANAANAAVATKQDGDAMLTALSALTTAADKGLYFTGSDAPSLYDITSYGRSLASSASAAAAKTTLGVVDAAPSLIEGLAFYRSAASTIKVGAGRAYIPSLGTVLRVPSELTLTLSGLTTGILYHIYLYSSSGTPTLEFSATDPELYAAPSSYQKTGDSSRRYIGSFLSISATDCFKFINIGDQVLYQEAMTSSLLAITSLFRVTTSTNVGFNGVVPITGVSVQIKVLNNIDTNAIAYFANPNMGAVSSTNYLFSLDASSGGNTCSVQLPVNSVQAINVIHSASGSSGGITIQLQGYTFRR